MASKEGEGQNRRDFIKVAALAGVTASLAAARCNNQSQVGEARSSDYKVDPVETVRLAYVGVGGPMDMDVYDVAAISAVSQLSEKSIAQKGSSIDFPDFTRGKWKTNQPLAIIEI